MHHLDSWIKRDQLDVTCFIISLFNAQHVSGVNTSILRSLRLICWVIWWVVLLWFDVCWCYVVVWLGWCRIRMEAEACIRIPHHTTTLEGGSGTVPEAVVTVLCTPDDGCGLHPRHVEWTCRIIERLHCVASRWTTIIIYLSLSVIILSHLNVHVKLGSSGRWRTGKVIEMLECLRGVPIVFW